MISFSSIGNVGDAARYHDKAFSQDGVQAADNYYLNEQAAAHWEGRGAQILGLDDKPVTREDFVAFLDGKMPLPGRDAVQDLSASARARGVERRPGVDFTVSPPKSVSIVALVGQDERVVKAHQAANTRAMEWLQEHGAVVRVRENGSPPTPEQAGNLLYATVLHETNRANEPQLHNHNVIVAAVYDEKREKWRSLTNDVLFKLRAQADVVYKAELAKGLRAEGYELEYAANGVDFEIKGFAREQVQAYSTRTGQIKAALIERGIDPENASFHARQTATVDSRVAKQEVPRDALHAVWRDAAVEARLDLPGLVQQSRQRAADRELELGQSTHKPERALRAVNWAIEHLAEREQTFRATELAITALKFDRTIAIDDIEAAIAIRRAEAGLLDKGLDPAGARLLTTPRARDSELTLAENINQGKGQGNVVMTNAAEFETAVRAFEARKSAETQSTFRLSEEQVTAARNILMHADTYQGIQGAAGTGKTAALELVREAAEAKGWEVLGMATSAAAAKELESSSGIKSQTVAGFFAERERAIIVTRSAIEQLDKTLAKDREAGKFSGQLVEHRKLDDQAGGAAQGKARYTFDHRQGDVFRSGTDMLSLIGGFFLDAAQDGRDKGIERPVVGETLGDRLKKGARALQIGASDFVGQNLSSFEKVGTAEAVAARTTLSLAGDPERNPQIRAVALKRAELKNLQTTGNAQGRKTLLVMDEASLTGAHDAADVSTVARKIGARVVFQGDVRQHGSVPAGRAFAQAQATGMKTSTLEETRRFDKASDQVKSALAEMKAGRFSKAYEALETRVVQPKDLAGAVATRYLANLEELRQRGVREPQVGVVVFTNRDRKIFNASINDVLSQNGLIGPDGHRKIHFDDPKLTEAQRAQVSALQAAGVDHLVFRQGYRDIGVQRGEAVNIVRFDVGNNLIVARTQAGKEVTINPLEHEKFTAVTHETRDFSVGGRVETRAIIRFKERNHGKIGNGARGVIREISASGATIRWDDGAVSRLTDEQLRSVDHSYARTSYKEQGATNDREIIALSDAGARIFNREAAYVAATRAKDQTEVITSDKKTTLVNADRDVTKSTAIDTAALHKIIETRLADAESRREQERETKQQVIVRQIAR